MKDITGVYVDTWSSGEGSERLRQFKSSLYLFGKPVKEYTLTFTNIVPIIRLPMILGSIEKFIK